MLQTVRHDLNLKTYLRQFFRGCATLLFPPICIVCQRRLPDSEEIICEACWDLLNPVDPESLAQKSLPSDIDRIYSGYYFDAGIQPILHALKYADYPSLGFRLGAKAARQIQAQISADDEAVLVPIPLHPIKQRERGYNQSLFIARGVHSILNIPLRDGCLRRIKNTATQTLLNAEEREVNMQDAFRIVERDRLAGFQTVVLVDDVFTTGATMNSAARVLKNEGIQRVVGFSVATPL